MIKTLEEVSRLLSGDLSYDNRAKAKEIVNSLIEQEKSNRKMIEKIVNNFVLKDSVKESYIGNMGQSAYVETPADK